ncbi:hydrolase [Diaporthe amygdali]|uniref:hydrolase n=1 Tax=Phomopsis amygdali TaxID=1214568 RepID=UPI0022FEAEBA|nr:hydrolase [Diaporthe amygdali]KAJ0117304.1 hydrolase [Diaporthe amygdali]
MSGPSQPQYDTQNEVMWFIAVQKEPSWTQERFLHEYQKVHVDLAREGHNHTKLPLSYVQVGARDLPDENNPADAWDFVTCLYWPNTFVVWKGFQNPAYRETAGKHVFCRLDQKGLLARKVGEVGAVTERFVEDGGFAVHVFHHREGDGDEVDGAWVDERLQLAKGLAGEGNLLREYSIWKDVTPKDTDSFFRETQFSGGSWLEFTAVERFVFRNREEAAQFWKGRRASIVGSPDSTYIVGGTASIAI